VKNMYMDTSPYILNQCCIMLCDSPIVLTRVSNVRAAQCCAAVPVNIVTIVTTVNGSEV
jgi:hypothetical protein